MAKKSVKGKAKKGGASPRRAASDGAGRKPGFGGSERPSRSQLERLVREVTDPAVVEAEGERFLRMIEGQGELGDVRFDHRAALEAARAATAEGAPPIAEDFIERLMAVSAPLVTDALRERVADRLDLRVQAAAGGVGARGAALRERLPFLVGRFLTKPDSEREPGKSPLWAALLRVTLIEAPLRLWLEARLREGDEARAALVRKALRGELRRDLEAWLDANDVLRPIVRILDDMDLGKIAGLLIVHAGDPDLEMPIDAALWRVVEVARQGRRWATLAGPTGDLDEDARADGVRRMLKRALAREGDRAEVAYRVAGAERLHFELVEAASALAGGGERERERERALRRAMLRLACYLGFEVLPREVHAQFVRAYMDAPEHAVGRASSDEEADLLEAFLDDPLDPAPVEAYARWLLGVGRADEAVAVAEVAADLGGEVGDLLAEARRARDAQIAAIDAADPTPEAEASAGEAS